MWRGVAQYTFLLAFALWEITTRQLKPKITGVLGLATCSHGTYLDSAVELFIWNLSRFRILGGYRVCGCVLELEASKRFVHRFYKAINLIKLLDRFIQKRNFKIPVFCAIFIPVRSIETIVARNQASTG